MRLPAQLFEHVLVQRRVRGSAFPGIAVRRDGPSLRPASRRNDRHSISERCCQAPHVRGMRFKAIDLSRRRDVEDGTAVRPDIRSDVENDAASLDPGSIVTCQQLLEKVHLPARSKVPIVQDPEPSQADVEQEPVGSLKPGPGHEPAAELGEPAAGHARNTRSGRSDDIWTTNMRGAKSRFENTAATNCAPTLASAAPRPP